MNGLRQSLTAGTKWRSGRPIGMEAVARHTGLRRGVLAIAWILGSLVNTPAALGQPGLGDAGWEKKTLALIENKPRLARSILPALAREAAVCPAFFGDSSAKARNAMLRAKWLDWVDEDGDGVTIAHAQERWAEPLPTRVRGVQLVRIVRRETGLAAELILSPDLAGSAHCPLGPYQVSIDDSLVGWGRVLAVLHQGLLAEHQGQLRFLALPAAEPPRWLLAWHMRAILPAGTLGNGEEGSSMGYLRE
jgi:hypothetical protein